jgi:hypothetical protein
VAYSDAGGTRYALEGAIFVTGAAVLFPSLYYLYRVFKPRAVFGQDR